MAARDNCAICLPKVPGTRGKWGWNSFLLPTLQVRALCGVSFRMEEEASFINSHEVSWTEQPSRGPRSGLFGPWWFPVETSMNREKLHLTVCQLNGPARTDWLIGEAMKAVQNSTWEHFYNLRAWRTCGYERMQIPPWSLLFFAS